MLKKAKPEPLSPPKASDLPKVTKEFMSGRLVDPRQELLFRGPPPAIKPLYATNKGFDKEFHPQDFVLQCAAGVFLDEIAAMWGLSAATLADWFVKYPELAEAKRLGATSFSAYWKRALRLAAFGQLPNMSEKSLHKILDNMVGLGIVGVHEFADIGGAEGFIVDGDGNEF